MWSAGVSLFLLLGGYPPFDASTTKEVFRRVETEVRATKHRSVETG